MDDSKLSKIALIWSLIGIVVLSFFVEFTEPKQISISESQKYLGNYVKILGKISSLSVRDKVTFIDLKDDSGEITCVRFEKINGLHKCKNIEVSGTVATYKGNLEVLIDELKCIS